MKKRILLSAAVLVLAMCTGCDKTQQTPVTTAATEPPITSITMVADARTVEQLPVQYPGLEFADLTGSTCYAAIDALRQSHPELHITYSVDLGGTAVSPDVTSLVLNPEEYSFSALRENLQYLHALRELYLTDCRLMPDTVRMLQKAYPQIKIGYNVSFCGSLYDSARSALDLSECDPQQVRSELAMLQLLPALQEIELNTQDQQSHYSLEDAAAIQQALPDADLHYVFTLFGKEVSTDMEEISYANQYIGNKDGNLEILRQALTVLKSCKRFVLDNCHFDNEIMAQVRDEFRGQTKVVWRIFYGEGSILTDRTVIRHVYNLYDSNSVNLKYCEDAEFIDIGHNEYLKHCDFVAGMPKLKAIILSGSMVSDLTPFAGCNDLEFIELAYCGYVTDLSPLASCSSLKRVNIAYTKVSDLSPLDALPLEALVYARTPVTAEESARADSLHPDCIIQHTGDNKDDNPYTYPWRYETNGDPNYYYAILQEKFHYPDSFNTIY